MLLFHLSFVSFRGASQFPMGQYQDLDMLEELTCARSPFGLRDSRVGLSLGSR